ncbi:Uma2 family endonuclease [Myxacorys almedinensis A]|uniref:Uma2 family endonuclease n=2 Tax=Myxacorys TaxID=2056239 RepID=A0A8J8CPA4_9CYAN|nr:Uma2 family endonuclease [Myxacorys almedinensis]NDJ19277.1 Uma2 family endonuclease [Myxacorys almedinensis A]
MALPDDGQRYELIDGELKIMGNSGMEHGYVACILTIFLGGFVHAHKLGVLCDSSTAFTMNTGNKRSPDVSFVAKERLHGLKKLPKGFFQGAPDLAVEVISPSNTFEEIHTKLVEYFESGSRLVWVINPDEESVLVYRQPQPDRLLKITDQLDGEEVIPEFTLAVSELFTELNF